QRIGRVHRLGQSRPVQVWTLAVRDSVEAYMLYLLHQKIRLFEEVIGDLEAILASKALQGGLETVFARALVDARDETEILARLDELAARVLEERQRIEESRERIPWL
ncbi:MAG TPA: hypothetical protein VIL08_01535, partial [Limnochorda sp.]